MLLTMMADRDEATPGTRTQPVQSIPSRPSPATIRSPVGSLPAGPPSGPAKRTRAPRRAMATAALAAHPPPTVMNSLAIVFMSAAGKRSTRNTWSSTAIPVHKTTGWRRSPSGQDTIALLDPRADDVVRDSDGWRRAETVGMPSQQHQSHLLTIEPAGVLQLGMIDLQLSGQ